MKLGAIDQGTTSSRALMLSDGEPSILRAINHNQHFPRPGWVEHDPHELIRNVWACAEALEDADAFGITNQGESCLAWDRKTGSPISPAIVWQDNRTTDVIERLKTDGCEDQIKKLSGLPLDPYFSASKLAWIFDNISDAKDMHREGRLALGTTDAFFLQHLVGRCVTDVTTASRTSLLNLQTLNWDVDLCELFGVPIETLPEILSTHDEYGDVQVHDRNIPLRASVVDQQAALYGHGCHQPGDAKVTLGTGAFVLSISGQNPITNNPDGLVPTVAWRFGEDAPTFALDGGVYNAGSALNWARSIGLFSNFKDIETFDGPSAIERGLVFVPALSGLACPHWRRESRGSFDGLSLDTGPLDMVQAVLEGVALRIGEVIAAMDRNTPIGDELSIDGGLSNNPYICQFLSDILKRRIRIAEHPEITAIGCAQMAGKGFVDTAPYISKNHVYDPHKNTHNNYLQQFSEIVSQK